MKRYYRQSMMQREGSSDRYKILSLFSGCGGLDLGFALLGADSFELEKIREGRRSPKGTRFEILWSNDIYEPSCRTYSVNFNAEIYNDPEEPYDRQHRIFQGDIAKIFFEKAVDGEEIDVVMGGFPCQDFSIIRGADKRLGIKVKRGRLYCHFVRALAWLQPKMFVVENVKGLVSANKGLAYEQIIDDFKNLKIRWSEIEVEYDNNSFRKEALNSRKLEEYEILFNGVIKFANFGVPQARERLIIVGFRKDLFHKLTILESIVRTNLENSLNGTGLQFSKHPLTPIESFYGDTLGSLEAEYKEIMSEFEECITKIESKRKEKFVKQVWPNYSMEIWKDYFWLNRNRDEIQLKKEEIEKFHKEILSELGYYQSNLNQNVEFKDESNEILMERKTVKERMKHIPPGENHKFVRDTEYHVTGLMSNIYRRVNPLKPSATIIARGGGGTWGYHYNQNRQRLTNRERARLQTFPDSFIFNGKPGQVRRQIGEAVPPLASKVIAKAIAKILDQVTCSS